MSGTLADQNFWNQTARRYARDPIRDMEGYQRTLARTRSLLSPADRILEIGCGTGTTALALAPSVAQVTATDISREMIAIAREKTGGSVANVRFEVGGAEDAPPGEGWYDAVLAFNLLHLIHDRRAALWSIRRILKPGGLLITKTPCLSEMNPLIRLAVPLMRIAGKAPYVSFFRAGDLEQEIADQGFRIRESARHGSGRRDARIFIVAEKPGHAAG
jgi:ubiquinone/menaquinone biosynthesis C-methylase UbiE